MRRRILVVLLDVPLPPTSGLHLRMLGTLRIARAVGCNSYAMCFETEERRDLDALNELADVVIGAGPRRPYGTYTVTQRVRDRASYLANLAARGGGRRYPFSTRWDDVGAERHIRDTAREHDADVVILPSILLHYAPVLRSQGVEVVADAADVMSDVTKAALMGSRLRSPRSLGLAINYLACRQQERLFLPLCSELWATSHTEAERFRSIAPHTPIVVVPNTMGGISADPLPGTDRRAVGFIGNYSYAPNLVAASILVEQVAPLLWACDPAISVLIAGSGLHPDVAQRWGRMGIEVLGPVSESADFFAACAVIALPIRVRGGVPLKLVEALARQRPVVATPELVAGLKLASGRELLVAASAKSMADSILELLDNREFRDGVASLGHAAYDREFSFESALDTIRRESLVARSRPSYRQAPHA